MLHHIEIRQPGESWLGTKVYADGKEIDGVLSADYHVEVGEPPRVTLELTASMTDVDALADVGLTVDYEDVQETVKCLQLAMKLDKELHAGVVASAKSILTEYGVDDGVATDMADAIIERIFFGEDEWLRA